MQNAKMINVHTHQVKNPERIVHLQNLFIHDAVPSETPINTYYSICLHPWFIDANEVHKQLHHLEQQLTHPQIIAIGETGLDKLCNINYDLQTQTFIKQIELSEKYGMPLIVHCIRAYNDIIRIRKKTKATQPWIIHGFRGKEILMLELINAGCIVSLGDDLLKQHSNSICNIKFIDHNQFFFETDESTELLEHIYKDAAHYRQQDLQQLIEQVYANFLKIFKLPL